MNAEIIAVGTEILLGDIVNTNAQFLSHELAALGINVYRHTTAGDNFDRLQTAFSEAFARVDLVITTGGLGPTADDISKEAVAAHFGLDMLLDEKSLSDIACFFDKIGQTMTENNCSQAMFPRGSKILDNPAGTAPGCIIEQDGKICILLPGPPNEMKTLWNLHIKPYLARFSDGILVSRTLKMVGIGESAMEDKVADILVNGLNPTVAPYAVGRPGEVVLRISAKAASGEAAKALMEPVAAELYARLGEFIYGEDDDTLAGKLVQTLAQRGLKLAIAESITGGQLASAVIACPGASEILDQAVVTYSNASKIKLLGVSPITLEKFGAVSEQVAIEMAEGAAKAAGADFALSTTGIAGPGGGTAEKPVGLTYIGLYLGGRTFAKKFQLFGDRTRIRDRAVAHALDMLRRGLHE